MKKKLYTLLVALMLSGTPIIAACSCSGKVRVLIDYGDNNHQTIEIDSNSVVQEVEAPTKAGYIFDGWFADAEYTTPFNWDTKVNSDITIYAKWSKACQITLATANLDTDGYSIELVESTNVVREGTAVTLLLKIADGYSNSQYQVLANESILTASIGEEKEGYTQYTLQTTINENTTIRVINVETNKYTITLPSIEGASIELLDDIALDKVAYGSSVRFRVNVSSGYSKDNLVVTVNGNRLTDNEGIFTIASVTSNQVVDISGISKITYTANVWDGEQELSANSKGEYTTDKFIVSNITRDLQYGDNCSFVISSNNQKYSQFDYTKPNVISVLVGGNSVNTTITLDMTNTAKKRYNVTIDSPITGNVRIEINNELITANTYTVTVPTTTIQQDGYKINITKYTIDGNATAVTDTDSITISYGERVYLSLDVDSDNYNTNNLELYTANAYRAYSGNEVYFDIYNDTFINLRGLSMKYHTITSIVSTGANILSDSGYDLTKAYYKDVIVGDDTLTAKTIKFKVQLDNGYTSSADYVVRYYYNLGEYYTLTPDTNGVYTISDISADMTIEVSGVQPKEYDITLPTITGANITFANGDVASTLAYGTTATIELAVDQAYTNCIDNIVLSCAKAELVDKQINGNTITYVMQGFGEDITADDWSVEGLAKNKYSITFGAANNYTLQKADGSIIDSSLIVEYGDSLTINIIKAEGYSQDDDYVVLVNGEEYSRSGDQIVLSGITGDIRIDINGIDTLDTYRIEYLDVDGSVLSYSELKYGSAIDLPQYTTAPEHYSFGSWHWATKDAEGNFVLGDEVAEGDIATSDAIIIAKLEAVKYYITFDLSNAEEWIDTISNSNVNTDDGKLAWTIEDVASGNLAWNNTGLSTPFYTFYRWVLAEDMTIGGVDYEAGTAIDYLTQSMLGNFTVKGEWIITVGADSSNNHDSIATAITYASKSHIDTIVLTESNYNEGSIVIDRSVNIITLGITANITYRGVGSLLNGHYSLFVIRPQVGTIDVKLQNLNIDYTCSSSNYSAVAINANNANLTLDRVTIDGKVNGILYQSEGSTALTLNGTSNSKIVVDNDNSVVRNYGVKVVANGANVNVNISNYSIWCNTDAAEYKGLWLSGTSSATATLDNVKFVKGWSFDDSAAVAMYLETSQKIALSNVGVNVNSGAYTPWGYGLVLGYKQDTTTGAEAAEIQNYLQGLTRDIVNANSNQFVNCVAIKAPINCYSSTIDANIVTESSGNVGYRLDYRTATQLSAMVDLGYNMYYVGNSDIDLGDASLTIANNQTIYFGNESNRYNVVCGTLINNGTINYAGTITASAVTNAGTMSANSITSEGITNTGELTLETLQVSAAGVMQNSGSMQVNNINISGTLHNGGSIGGRDITINGSLNVAEGGAIKMWYITNNGNITNSGTITAMFTLNNSVGAVITNETSGEIVCNFPDVSNNGEIINNGTINQQYDDILLNSNYGIVNAGLDLDLTDGKYTLSGSANKAADDTEVAAMYPNGSGYYVSLLVYVDMTKAGQSVEVEFNRTEQDGVIYDYTTKTATDTLSASGALDIIIDLNMIDGSAGLKSITINISGKTYVIDINNVVAAK